MNYKVLIIGHGSIGKRHAFLLKKRLKLKNIFIFTKQKINNYKSIHHLKNFKSINPNYIIIASSTKFHFNHLKYLEKNFKKIKILVEKPLFDKDRNLKIKNNKVFVGYNLRFHPIIKYIKKKLNKKKVIDIKIISNSFLPYWRKNRDYKKTSSAQRKLGGGVLLDLSHEIDLARWLFGEINLQYVLKGKFSKLAIDTDDLLRLYGKINKANLSLDLNYYSRIPIRKIIVDLTNSTFHADLIHNELKIKTENSSKTIKFPKFKIDDTYIEQHRAILNNNKKILCDYDFAKKTMKIIDKIQK